MAQLIADRRDIDFVLHEQLKVDELARHERFAEFNRKAVDLIVSEARNLVRVHLAEFQNDPDMAIVYEIETHQSSRLAEEQIREMAKMYQDILAEIVELGQQEGFIRKNLYVGLVKRFILGAVEETINTWLRSGRGYDLVSMADPLVDLLLRGIGNPERMALEIQENP